jgi:hypothetical protein
VERGGDGGGAPQRSSLGFHPSLRVRPMAAPPPLAWADAPPYHYHGTPLPLPKTSPPEEAAAPDEPRSLYIRGLLPWMNEDYLYSCFTRVPEVGAQFRLPC